MARSYQIGASFRTPFGWLLAVAAVVYLLSFPRVLGRSDESYLLYGAKRLLQGQAIYADFFDCITPASYYLFAAVFTLTGPSLLAARIAMALIHGISCLLLFGLARRVAGLAEAALAVLTFAVLCVPVWPYASPHWISTCLGLAVAATVLAGGWRTSARARPAVAGVLAGLTFCVQQQRGVFVGAWLAIAIALLALSPSPRGFWRRLRGELGSAAAGGSVVVLVILGHAAWRSSIAQLTYALYTFVRESYAPANVGTTSWAGFMPLSTPFLPYTWHWLLRAAPAVLVLEGGSLALQVIRRPAELDVTRVCLLLLAVVMAASIIYFPDYIHVAYILPFLLLPAARVVHGARSLPLWRRHALLALAPPSALVLMSLALVAKGASNLQLAEREAPQQFASAVGPLRGDVGSRRLLETLQRLHRDLPADRPGRDLLFAYAADTWLYLAVPGDNPTPFSALLHGFHTPRQFAQAVAALRSRQVPVIVALTPFMAADDPIRRLLDQEYVVLEDLWPYGIYGRKPDR